MKRMYFSVINAMGIRLDWLDGLTNDFIGACLQKRKKLKKNWHAAVPAIEAGENDMLVDLQELIRLVMITKFKIVLLIQRF